MTEEGRKFIIDYKLEELETLLNPENFMRVNRSFILHIDSIKDVIVISNSRLKVMTSPEVDREIIISREKVPQFKAWIDGRA
jgi:DNA-binding LytR/AlgR family response regulator